MKKHIYPRKENRMTYEKNHIFWVVLHYVFILAENGNTNNNNSNKNNIFFKNNLLMLGVHQHSDYAINYFLK